MGDLEALRSSEAGERTGEEGDARAQHPSLLLLLVSIRLATYLPSNFDISILTLTSVSLPSLQARFKAKAYDTAIQLYGAALAVASQRMPWEASGIFKEEMSTVLCNRSAAYGACGKVG